MAARRAQRPAFKPGVSPNAVEDEATSRALDALSSAVGRLQSSASSQIVEFDLVVGVNAVPHSLGRAVKSVSITPTVADESFAYALTKSHALATKQALITVIGVDQPGATLELK